MTGRKVKTTPSSDGNCDVFSTVSDKVRILTSCHYSAADYNINVAGLTSVGYPANGQIQVNVTKFDSTSDPYSVIAAPTSVGNFQMTVNNGVGSIPVFTKDKNFAYTFEFYNKAQ